MRIFTRMIFITVIFFSSCEERAPMPKPRAYPRVEYPERSYTTYENPECPFTFRFPGYAEIAVKKEKCWFDLYMPAFNARLHCSYHPLSGEDTFDDYLKDAFVIAKKINEKANYMEEARIQNPNGVGGLLLNWSGPAASPVHFFMSDTTHHFFKAALYFDSRVKPDSLAPITEFIRSDMDTLISSFSWKKN
jgi:gliding motility-associated lipoprotein GldD